MGVGGNGAQGRWPAAWPAWTSRCARWGIRAACTSVAFDADDVSPSNVGRQLYSPSDVGQNKALLTIHRLNLFYGLDWQGRPWRYEQLRPNDAVADIVVSVDSRSARRALHQGAEPPGLLHPLPGWTRATPNPPRRPCSASPAARGVVPTRCDCLA